jgi:hypothetical protein
MAWYFFKYMDDFTSTLVTSSMDAVLPRKEGHYPVGASGSFPAVKTAEARSLPLISI